MAYKTADEIASLFYDSPRRVTHNRGLGTEHQVTLTVKQVNWLHGQVLREDRKFVSNGRYGGSGTYSVNGEVKGGWTLRLLPNGAGLLNFSEDEGRVLPSWATGLSDEQKAEIAALRAEIEAERKAEEADAAKGID